MEWTGVELCLYSPYFVVNENDVEAPDESKYVRRRACQERKLRKRMKSGADLIH